MSSSISTHELWTKEALISVMRSTLPIGTYEDAIGDYLAAGDFFGSRRRRYSRGGGCSVCRL
jgi:hypothetical protein